MALTWHKREIISGGKAYYEGACLAADEKPTGDHIFNGSKLMEMDTSTMYIYDAENGVWREWT